MVNIEIDGKKLEVPQGKMIIEVADEVGIPIPRFCYHKKLSIAANCRMCLVDVGNAPKALPACATPVSEGMKIFTLSARAVEAQKAVMEFLLINHPLDCPVCDQGGECELQDVALEYGQDYSRYTEPKRVVKDKNIGPLISTEMTRCIHCTRCVRFGTEVAGVRELGATGRGEFMEIGTYVEKTVNSEMSGNVIDLCPVGALTSKPFRFSARAWELQSSPSISAHDCLGSNLYFHAYKGKVARSVPRDNEALNEVWLSDRDRFSYEGLNHPDRLTQPWIKRNGQWEATDWPQALQFAVEKLQTVLHDAGPEQMGVLASPNATIEEFYLLQKLTRALGSANIDHRLKDLDTSHQTYRAIAPSLGISLNDLETQEAILLIGSDIRKEQPIMAHRLRKAALHGTQVVVVNPCGQDFNFPVKHEIIGQKADLIRPLMEVLKALQGLTNKASSSAIESLLAKVEPSEAAVAIANDLNTKKASVILGAYAITHPQAGLIYALSEAIAKALDATLGEMTAGANSAGGWLAGAVPHRLPMGQVAANSGLTAGEMLEKSLKAYVLLHCEPEFDCADPLVALSALDKAQAVVAMTAFDNAYMREYADVLLPVTPISEMTGTYVNAFADWQTFQPAVLPLGESRPAWKVLRVLGNLMNLADFNYESVDEVLSELRSFESKSTLMQTIQDMPIVATSIAHPKVGQLVRLGPTPLYAVDGITRRAASLQQTEDAQSAVVKVSLEQARKLGLKEEQHVWVTQGGVRAKASMPIVISELIPVGTAWVAQGIEQTQTLGAPFGLIELTPAG